MSGFSQRWQQALRRTRPLLADFGRHFQPVSMATSAETGAFLQALLDSLQPTQVVETGSGFSSALLIGATHVEDNADYGRRVAAWLDGRGLPRGRFIDYAALHAWPLSGPFLLFLDGNLATREASATWLHERLAQAVLVIDDAQPGTFGQVQAVLDRLRGDPRGRLLDCAAWTRDEYGRHAALWAGHDSGLSDALLAELAAGPRAERPAAPPAHLLLCINDTPENGRWACTVRTLTSIGITADLRRHELWIVDNGSRCPHSALFLQQWCADMLRRGARLRRFRLPENRHATYAFNRLLSLLPPDAHAVRLENDIEFHTPDWPAMLVGFLQDSGFGLVSAKPVDLPRLAAGAEVVDLAGRRVQVVPEVPGFCTAFAPGLRQQLGALACAGRYIEDVLTSQRALALGWRMAFLQPDELRCFHVDQAASASYSAWKRQAVAEEWAAMQLAREDWRSGRRSPLVAFGFDAADGFEEVV